jgi:hypothetical protein
MVNYLNIKIWEDSYMVISGEMINRPYTPPSNVVSVLQRLRSRNLPERINTEYLRDAGIPEGTVSRTLFALRFLGLIDEGGLLTESLKSIHTATDEEYRAILSGLIKEAYKEVFSVVDPSQDSQETILNVFRRYTPASQRMRMVIFFLGMCREAGIPTLDVPKARSMAERAAKSEAKKPSTRRASSQETIKANRPATQTGINPALEGLIRTLPEPGEALSKERREQWMKMAEATLMFLYPETITNVVEDIKEDEQEDND